MHSSATLRHRSKRSSSVRPLTSGTEALSLVEGCELAGAAGDGLERFSWDSACSDRVLSSEAAALLVVGAADEAAGGASTDAGADAGSVGACIEAKVRCCWQQSHACNRAAVLF